MAEQQLPKLTTGVRFPSPAPVLSDLLDLEDRDLILAVRAAGHFRRGLETYLRGLPVLPDDRLGTDEAGQVRAAERFLSDGELWSDPQIFRPIIMPGLRGLRVIATPRPHRNLVLLEKGEAVACIRNGLPLVAPSSRGRGLGTLLVLISDVNDGRFLCPVSYSRSGLRARRSAHALQVRIAKNCQGAPFPGQEKTGAEAPVPVS